jgi:hypothetical protein
MNIGYRMTVFDGPLYYTGSTVITPAAGAPHSESFKITTFASGSIAGYAPYMRTPRGSRGASDIRTSTSTVGQYSVEILDARVGTANDSRWVTAFIGDTNSNLTIIGKKTVIEESLDGGTTWNPFFVGRINNITLNSNLTYVFELGDPLELLKDTIFNTEPAVSYSSFKSILPVGYTKNVTVIDSGSTVLLADGLQVETVLTPNVGSVDRYFKLDKTSVNRIDNNFDASTLINGNTYFIGTTYAGAQGYRALVLNNGQYYVYKVVLLRTPNNVRTDLSGQKIETIGITALDTQDPLYAAISNIGLNDKPKVWVYKLVDDNDKVGQFYLNETPYNILRDILRGKFFNKLFTIQTTLGVDTYLNNSQNIPFNEASIAAVESVYPLSKVLYKIDKPMSAAEFIEKHICQPYSLGYTFVPESIDGSVQSAFNLFSTQQPTTVVGIPTLNNTVITTAINKEWKTNEPVLFVKGTYYVENLRGGRYAVPRATTTGTNSSDPIATQAFTVIYGNLQQINDPSYKIIEIDFSSIRGINSDSTTFTNVGLIENTLAADWARSNALKLAANMFNRFKSGNPEILIECIRNNTTNAIDIGDFVLVNSDVLPNQALRTRGGTRIFQVTEKNIDGIRIKFSLFDSGINTTMTAPSFGSITSPLANIISGSIITTQNANVELEYAVVAEGGAQPATNSMSWLLHSAYAVNNTTKGFVLLNLPEGRTIYLRARAVTPDITDVKLPSAYVYSSGSTLSGIAAPSAVSVSNITNRSATVNWTNSNSFYNVEILLASPAGVPSTSIIDLPASSSVYNLIGLNENTSTGHTVGVRYTDNFGGFSRIASASFTASGSAVTLDAPAALTLYIKR